MPRKNLNLAYITHDSTRKATFTKRKKGLMKKLSEISTLCGIDACAIIYNSSYDFQPEVWPSPSGVQHVLTHFKNMPEMDKSKKMMNQESFVRQMITKSTDQLNKQRKNNREKEITQIMFQSFVGKSLEHLSLMDLNDLGWVTEQHLEGVLKRRELLRNDMSAPTAVAAEAATETALPLVVAEKAAVAPPPSPPPERELAAPIAVLHSGDQSVQSDERPGFETNMDSKQTQPLFNFENIGWEDMILPFGDIDHNARWSDGLFP